MQFYFLAFYFQFQNHQKKIEIVQIFGFKVAKKLAKLSMRHHLQSSSPKSNYYKYWYLIDIQMLSTWKDILTVFFI